VSERRVGRLAFFGYLAFAALLLVALGLRYEQGWGLALLLAGAPWTFIIAVALDGVGLVRLPFELAWETVLGAIGVACVFYNATIWYVLARRAARVWRRRHGAG
jgi:hypothetical protein